MKHMWSKTNRTEKRNTVTIVVGYYSTCLSTVDRKISGKPARIDKNSATPSGTSRGPVVKNPPSNARDMGLIPGWGTETPHPMEQLSLCMATTEPMCN